MGSLNQWIGNYLFLLILFLLLLVVINLSLFVNLNKKLKKYRTLLRGNEGKNIEELLLTLSEKITVNSEQTQEILEDFAKLKLKVANSFQKWSLIRFKAFENTGGDQSFAFALLDEEGNGVVVSSIFGREESRVYCKTIQAGISNYPLSREEKEAIQKALGLVKK